MSTDIGEKNKQVYTAGQVLTDGTVLDLMANPSASGRPLLCCWKGQSADIAPSIMHEGIEYVPIELEAGLSAALRFPEQIGPEEPLQKLFSDTYNRLNQKLNQTKLSILKLTLTILASWVSDVLPISPVLWITAGPTSPRDLTRQLLALLCRRPLVLSNVRSSDLGTLPWEVHPTLIFDECETRASFISWLRTSSRRGINFVRGGRIFCSYGPKIVVSRELPRDLDASTLFISLTPSRKPGCLLDDNAQNEIAAEFQPRLLSYRLRNLAKMRAPQGVVDNVTPPAQELANALRATVVGNEILEKSIVKLLRGEEAEYRLDRSRTIDAVLVEAILCFCHEQEQKLVRTADLAIKVNAILAGRGASEEVSPETAGWILKRLGIARRRIGSAGNGIELTEANRRIVHTAALSLCAPGTLVGPGCKYCEDCTNPESQENSETAAM